MKYIGIDYGEKRIGIAVSDDNGLIAFPRCVIDGESVRKKLAALAADEGIGGVVIGLPLGLNGEDGLAAMAARKFGAKVQEWLQIPVTLWDERMTTSQALRVMDNRRKGNADMAAAALILQSYLDSLKHDSGSA